MKLQHELVFEQARIVGIGFSLTKEDPKVTLAIRASLTTEAAETFGCRDIVYAGSVPRSGIGKITLEGSEIDCDCHFRHDNLAFSAVADLINHYVADMDSEGPALLFRIHLTGYADTAADIANKVRIDPLEITLKPAQLPMELHEEAAEPVEMDTGCVACNNEIPLVDGDPTLHISGSPCAVQKPAEEVEDAGATVAPAAVMGGTHQKRGRGRPRKVEPITGAADPVDDFMSDIGAPGEVVQ